MRTFAFGLAGALAALAIATSAAAQDPGASATVQYEIGFDNASHHEAQVSATWRQAPAGPLKVQMSRSSPGRYAIHEFAKNVYRVSATDGAGRPLRIRRTDPYSWIVEGHDGTVRVTYTLFADRADGTYSQIDPTHAHLNMPATFLWASGYDDKPIRVRFKRPDPKWSIATQLPPAAEPDVFWAPNLQYFMDSPTEIAELTWREWTVTEGGRSYTMRLALHHTGTAQDADTYAEKLKRLAPEHVRVWGEAPRFDYGTYTFLADYMPQVTRDGMEHRNSTYLTDPRALASANFAQLGTASHELAHAWNVERLRPAELEPFDFSRANATPSLWLAEGFTSYYGPLLIRRSGQSTTDEFLADLGRLLNAVVISPGRAYGSPQEMSLRAPFNDAATALDPVNRHTFTSYYPYGAVIGLALDLQLRGRPKALTLDDYMRRLWRTHGAPEKPYRQEDLARELAALTGDAAYARGFMSSIVESSELPDFAPLLAQAGLQLRAKSPGKAWLGAQKVKVSGAEVTLDEPPAPGAGLYEAGLDLGDRIVSVGSTEIRSESDWQAAVAQLKPGQQTTIRFVQRGITREAPLKAQADPTLEVVRFEAAGLKPTPAQLAFRTRWLGGESGAAAK